MISFNNCVLNWNINVFILNYTELSKKAAPLFYFLRYGNFRKCTSILTISALLEQ